MIGVGGSREVRLVTRVTVRRRVSITGRVAGDALVFNGQMAPGH